MMKKLMLIATIALALSACAQVNVTAFHTLPESLAGKTFEMVPGEKQQGSLEWKAYAEMVASKLEAKGLRQVAAQSDADYGVFVFYWIDGGATTVSAVPTYGQTSSGKTTTTTSYVGRMPITQTSYTPPTYGITGYYPASTTTYGKGMLISIMDVRKSVAERKPVMAYEAKITSTGSSNSINEAIPALVAAAFKDWPGKSGTTRRVEILD